METRRDQQRDHQNSDIAAGQSAERGQREQTEHQACMSTEPEGGNQDVERRRSQDRVPHRQPEVAEKGKWDIGERKPWCVAIRPRIVGERWCVQWLTSEQALSRALIGHHIRPLGQRL